MKGKWLWILLLVCSVCGKGYAQVDSVARCLEKIRMAEEDSVKLAYAGEITELLEQTVYGSYDPEHPVKYLNYRKCTNAEAEMYCWAVPLRQGQAFYHLFRFQQGRNYRLVYLPGKTDAASAWLFYDWLACRNEGEEYYVFLGWNRDKSLNRKTVRIVRFGEDGQVMEGPPLIRYEDRKVSHLNFEYAADGSMLLKQERQGKRILLDHLAPNDPKYEGYYMLYGADGSYDALEWKEGEWWFRTDVKAFEGR